MSARASSTTSRPGARRRTRSAPFAAVASWRWRVVPGRRLGEHGQLEWSCGGRCSTRPTSTSRRCGRRSAWPQHAHRRRRRHRARRSSRHPARRRAGCPSTGRTACRLRRRWSSCFAACRCCITDLFGLPVPARSSAIDFVVLLGRPLWYLVIGLTALQRGGHRRDPALRHGGAARGQREAAARDRPDPRADASG